MFRQLLPVLLAALCVTGCVPVTEPIGNVEKAEPDKALVGEWTVKKSAGPTQQLNVKAINVDIPAVKGNPKGLMRANTEMGDGTTELWFYNTTIGKHTYVTVFLSTNDPDEAKFSTEGNYEKWKKETKHQYFVFRYTRDGDKLTLDCANYNKFQKLMSDEKIPSDGKGAIEYYSAPAGWLDKYLDKTGPAVIYDGSNYATLERKKK